MYYFPLHHLYLISMLDSLLVPLFLWSAPAWRLPDRYQASASFNCNVMIDCEKMESGDTSSSGGTYISSFSNTSSSSYRTSTSSSAAVLVSTDTTSSSTSPVTISSLEESFGVDITFCVILQESIQASQSLLLFAREYILVERTCIFVGAIASSQSCRYQIGSHLRAETVDTITKPWTLKQCCQRDSEK